MMEKKRSVSLLPALICLAGMAALLFLWRNAYQNAVFSRLSAFCGIFLEQNPQLEGEVLSALQEYQRGMEIYGGSKGEDGRRDFLARYGYEAADFAPAFPAFGAPGTGERGAGGLTACSIGLALAASAAVFFLLQRYGRKEKNRIDGLTDYLEQVNRGAPGTLLQEEDGFSCLRDEIYKTVTGLYAARDEAVRARKNFADNLANIAHQLKTPLTAALLSLQLMETKAPNPYAEPVRKQLERLTRLEEALLSLSRIDSGTLFLKREEVDVFTALNLAAENLEDLLRERHVSVEISDRGRVCFPGDLEWTMEALMNLMKNCLEHSPAGGCIHCDYSANPLYVRILIRDEGEGFEREDIPHLFERFYRGKNAAEGSTGIGLALSRAVFERQNGTLAAYNLPGDGGSASGACFEVRVYGMD